MARPTGPAKPTPGPAKGAFPIGPAKPTRPAKPRRFPRPRGEGYPPYGNTRRPGPTTV
jgi:hypothetical protein